MTKRDGSDCEYVEIFSHRIGSICTQSRGTALVGRTDAKQGKVPNIPMRNTVANNIRDGRAGFKATIGLFGGKKKKKKASGCCLRMLRDWRFNLLEANT
jgi:hypothetical protein